MWKSDGLRDELCASVSYWSPTLLPMPAFCADVWYSLTICSGSLSHRNNYMLPFVCLAFSRTCGLCKKASVKLLQHEQINVRAMQPGHILPARFGRAKKKKWAVAGGEDFGLGRPPECLRGPPFENHWRTPALLVVSNGSACTLHTYFVRIVSTFGRKAVLGDRRARIFVSE